MSKLFCLVYAIVVFMDFISSVCYNIYIYLGHCVGMGRESSDVRQVPARDVQELG